MADHLMPSGDGLICAYSIMLSPQFPTVFFVFDVDAFDLDHYFPFLRTVVKTKRYKSAYCARENHEKKLYQRQFLVAVENRSSLSQKTEKSPQVSVFILCFYKRQRR